MRMECSYCSEQAVLGAGKGYCESHLGIYESRFIEQAVANKFKSKHEMLKFFMWAFGSNDPKLSDLQKWNGRIERKERKECHWKTQGIYVESQDRYICRIADEYINERKKQDSMA